MTNAQQQNEISNAVLVSVTADSATQRATLQFSRDVLLLANAKLPIQFCDGSAHLQDVAPQATWRKDAPGVISVAMPWPIAVDDGFFVFVPEQMTGLKSITGGRVLAGVMWGVAA